MSEFTKQTGGLITELLIPINVTSQETAYSNRVYLSPDGKIPRGKQGKRFIRMKGYVLAAEFQKNVPKGKMALNKKFRQFLGLSLIDQVLVSAYDPKPTDRPAASLHLKIQLMLPPKQRVQLDDLQLLGHFRKEFSEFYVKAEQVFVLNFAKTPIVLTVEKVQGEDDGLLYLGPKTLIQASASGEQQIRLKSTKQQQKNVFSANFSMETLGIGGLDKELTNLFRRAFASRRLPHSILEKFGLKHIKGILLYGPPGTGKTLIARQLSIALKAKSIQIVNGPQVFDKYVGQSEENIRKLFAPARQDEKRYGQESPLHIIVFDEIDAICRQRGSDGSGTGTKDGVVNQLLTNLDGVDALNNIIVIGMTNRKDLIDEAILRPGRLEVHLQITIPSEEGRLQILKIHTRQLKEQGLLDNQLDLAEIAKLAKNYTGAELEAVVKNAVSFALQRGNDITKFSHQLVIKAGTKVIRQDFLVALGEVLPGFGLDQEKMETYTRKQLHKYAGYHKIWNALEKTASLALAPSKPLTTLLMYGPKGSGKTSIACNFACKSEFTYVKIIAPERYIGVDTYGRINSMTKIFNDAYKSTKSLIILDNIERLIEYVPTGPDYNNRLMQALMVLVKRIPTNPDCHLLVIATSSNYRALELLDIDKYFAVKLKVPLLTPDEAAQVIKQKGVITESKPIKEIINFMEVSKNQRYSPTTLTPQVRV